MRASKAKHPRIERNKQDSHTGFDPVHVAPPLHLTVLPLHFSYLPYLAMRSAQVRPSNAKHFSCSTCANLAKTLQIIVLQNMSKQTVQMLSVLSRHVWISNSFVTPMPMRFLAQLVLNRIQFSEAKRKCHQNTENASG